MAHGDAHSELLLSTHEAALVMDCHPQTVRDRCDRNELPYTRDPVTGHRRIAAAELEARGYDLARMRRIARPGRGRFSAALTAQMEGVVSDAVGQELAEHVLDALSERDAALVASAEQLGATRAALRELAAARFWQRPRVLRRLRAAGMLIA
jgi:hypothetical protein